MLVERIPVTDRASWLAMRQQDVTASDIAAVAGVDPRRSRLRVWAEKAGMVPGVEENNLMRRGRWMEPAAIAALAEVRPTWDVRRATVYLRAPELRIGATPDAVAIDPEREGHGVVQIKVVSAPVFERDWRTPEGLAAPLYYQLQTLTEARLAGAAWAVVAALVIDTFDADLHLVDVQQSEGAWARLTREVESFWRSIEAGAMPAIDPVRDAETLAALYPREADTPQIDLPAELVPLLTERAELKATIKAAEERVDEIDAVAKAALGNAAIGTCPPFRVTWKTEHRAERVQKAWTGRVLRISQPKELARGRS
jgi:putative phage-type endonuclease